MMEELMEKIKEFLDGKNAEYNIGQPEETVNDTTLVEIKLGKPIELTENEYEKLSDLLRFLGFRPTDIWENRVNDSLNYRSYKGVDEFLDKNNDQVRIYYTKVSTGDETTYFVNKIEFETEENIQKYFNELKKYVNELF
ncbi:hypothetical protein [Sulfolobus monocaudavirus SMV3]|uniref:hypothetical protein n=1 Tax=Sulfolobus monocaudavirus SMV3 TaxID=1732177 RepID=UPI00070619FA|nr:hypothetical protein AXI69_gp53 [Sulfolobus monocaudavirus SMV3]ALG96990.1 hypothetical protein [Sulfolobus monocaudavirus SMV3]